MIGYKTGFKIFISDLIFYLTLFLSAFQHTNDPAQTNSAPIQNILFNGWLNQRLENKLEITGIK